MSDTICVQKDTGVIRKDTLANGMT